MRHMVRRAQNCYVATMEVNQDSRRDRQGAHRFPGWADRWQLRTRTLMLSAFSRPRIMGIVNVTPDSFSDGGRFFEPAAAVERSLELVADGADILDIGGESTRPYSTPVSTDEELRRVLPVVEAVCDQTDVPVSIDTSKAKVAAEAIAAGAEIINDVTGLERDPNMVPLAADTGAAVCAMHMQGTPQTMQDNPTYGDVVEEVFRYLEARRNALEAGGIARERICLDPGIGFGKTPAHNLAILAACHRYHRLGCPVLVGHSRKGFIAQVLGDPEADRAAGTLAVGLVLAQQGVQILRVHDVRSMRQALILADAVGGLSAAGPIRTESRPPWKERV